MNKQGYKFNIPLNRQGVSSRKGGGQGFAWAIGNSPHFSDVARCSREITEAPLKNLA